MYPKFDVRAVLWAIAICFGSSSQVSAQPFDGPPIRIEKADSHGRNQLQDQVARTQWTGAAETMTALLETPARGFFLDETPAAAMPFEFRLWRSPQPSTLVYLQRLVRNHPELLVAYRRKNDSTARTLLEKAVQDRDQLELTRLSQQYFFSSMGDEILLELGAIHYQAGRFRQAVQSWSAISPNFSRWRDVDVSFTETPAGHDPARYQPDTDLPLPQIAALLVLAASQFNSVEHTDADLLWFQTEFGEAVGSIGGKQGVLRDLLMQAIQASAASEPSTGEAAPHPAVDARPLDPSGFPIWTVDLLVEDVAPGTPATARADPQSQYEDAFNIYPAIFNGQMVWQDGWRIRSIQLSTGDATFAAGKDIDRNAARRGELWRGEWRRATEVSRESQWSLPRNISLAGHRAFALTGAPPSPNKAGPTGVASRPIIGIDLKREGMLLPGFPLLPDEPDMTFDSQPVVWNDRLLLLARRWDADKKHVGVYAVCYALTETDSNVAQPPLWKTRLFDAQVQQVRQLETSGLQTDPGGMASIVVADERMICNTNLGAIAALNPASGVCEWLLEYPRIDWFSQDPDVSRQPQRRKQANLLVEGDQVFAAPSDTSLVMSLSAHSGRMAWAQELPDVRFLLQASEHHLIAGGLRVKWLERRSGKVQCVFPEYPVPQAPWPGDAAAWPGAFRIRGRPLVTDNYIYVPTLTRVFILRQQPAQIVDGGGRRRWLPVVAQTIGLWPRGLAGGNLFENQGMMIVVGDKRIAAFTVDGRIPAKDAVPNQSGEERFVK